MLTLYFYAGIRFRSIFFPVLVPSGSFLHAGHCGDRKINFEQLIRPYSDFIARLFEARDQRKVVKKEQSVSCLTSTKELGFLLDNKMTAYFMFFPDYAIYILLIVHLSLCPILCDWSQASVNRWDDVDITHKSRFQLDIGWPGQFPVHRYPLLSSF